MRPILQTILFARVSNFGKHMSLSGESYCTPLNNQNRLRRSSSNHCASFHRCSKKTYTHRLAWIPRLPANPRRVEPLSNGSTRACKGPVPKWTDKNELER